ncbi:MAG: MBL fold metallo-hydrolase [Dehalococcoidia bacterium]|jgi:L-ascorbate metabolism protein UlaG (beta-lactamase superfamily)
MEIVWLGHSCFRIRGKEATIVTDPFDKTLGYPVKKPTASIVTVSHQHPQHSYLGGVTGNPRVISRPGEYEIANVFINGIATFHDAEMGEQRGKNTVYLIQIEEVSICHLGDLGHVPTAEQIEQMSDADILMVPVGGGATIGATAAVETISLLQPKLVIPMHFKTEVVKMELAPLEPFLKEMGVKEFVSQPKLSVTKSSLPIETSVVVLDYN